MDEPLDRASARQEIGRILASPHGTVIFTRHARIEMAKDDLDELDCINTLRSGVVEPAEWENGAWRYRVRRYAVWVVVQFVPEDDLLVITAWRNRR